MRTSTIISCSALVASSVHAFSFAAPEHFDNSLLRARAVLPNVVAMDSPMLVKRADGPWDCSEDEEYVAYDDDDEEEQDTPVFEPSKQQGQVKAVVTPPASTQPAATTSQKQEQKQEQQTQATTSSSSSSNDVKVKSAPTPAPKSASTSSSVSTPSNVADGTYTSDEGCARYYEVKAGDICLKLVEENQDLGLTLDQLYCLNPAIDDQCFNLWIGTSYCVGYNGEEPLNTGVSSK